MLNSLATRGSLRRAAVIGRPPTKLIENSNQLYANPGAHYHHEQTLELLAFDLNDSRRHPLHDWLFNNAREGKLLDGGTVSFLCFLASAAIWADRGNAH